MSKDRARPFSRKHRKYWLTITGGMVLICVVNVAIGLCSYSAPPPPPERIVLTLPAPTVVQRPAGTISVADVPAAVMRAFADKYPKNVPKVARKITAPDVPVVYELTFGADGTRATFREDGTFVDGNSTSR